MTTPTASHRTSTGAIPRIIIAVAPVAHEGAFLPPSAANPVTPEAIAAETVRCADAGATVVHLHVRDRTGRIVADTTVFAQTLDLILDRCDVIVNGSTGGASELSREERCVSLTDPRVEVASLNMGSTNFADGVYINRVPDIRYWARRIREAGVVPELEVFATGMIESAREFVREGVLAEPLHTNVCLGFPGATPATHRHLAHFAELLADEPWGFLHEGMTDLRLVAAAIGMGARLVRVGFEDGGYLRSDRAAHSNAELVDQLARLVRACGAEPATVAEARQILGTKGR